MKKLQVGKDKARIARRDILFNSAESAEKLNATRVLRPACLKSLPACN
jgi:hypothetical protein